MYFVLCVVQNATPTSKSAHHDLGHIFINGIDLNCHGFTEFLCEERVEYAWMMQLLLGRITGALSSLQVSFYSQLDRL